jgi:FkbM family methyltransferase
MKELTAEIAALMPRLRGATFIQVGSGDGVSGDPIHSLILQYRWTGVLIEPVSYVFQRLIQNYSDCPGLEFENCAIAETAGKRDFWFLRESPSMHLPFWYDQIGTLRREILMKHVLESPLLKELLLRETVPCKSLRDILFLHPQNPLDLLIIDVEGHDHEILKQVDGTDVNPRLVVFERKHLTSDEIQDSRTHLTGLGYQVFDCENDTLGVKTST